VTGAARLVSEAVAKKEIEGSGMRRRRTSSFWALDSEMVTPSSMVMSRTIFSPVRTSGTTKISF
jgi:hypothetical protein